MPMRKILLSILLPWLIACDRQNESLDTQISVPVSVEEILPQSIEEFVSTTGSLNAIKEANYKAETDGLYRLATNQSKGRAFTLGDFVKKNDVIIYLDNPELESNVKIESQELNLDISKREFEKQNSLYEKGGVTLRELKAAEKTYSDAKYNYENALLQLAKLRIVAPFDGIIVDLPYYTPGVRVDLNAPMVSIMDYQKLYSEVNLPGKELGRIQTGQMVRVTNYSLPGDTLVGQVMRVAPAFDPTTRSFKAVIEVENRRLNFRPGMFIKADVVVARTDSTIVVSKNIVLSRQNGKVVYVVERGVAVERRIVTGMENPSHFQIVEGLQMNERLVVKGFETLQNRSKVRIIR